MVGPSVSNFLEFGGILRSSSVAPLQTKTAIVVSKSPFRGTVPRSDRRWARSFPAENKSEQIQMFVTRRALSVRSWQAERTTISCYLAGHRMVAEISWFFSPAPIKISERCAKGE
jgi:hypothetical protein